MPPISLDVLSAYRSLLRATTYLHDSVARQYIHKAIVEKFKSSKSEDNIPKRHGKLLKARKQIALLEAAGSGRCSDVEQLSKVLHSAYGRRGRRRRELLSKFIRPDESMLPKNAEDLESFLSRPTAKADPYAKGTKIHALIVSHTENIANNPRGKIKRAFPSIPEENIWGRPTPVKLVKGLKRKWWASTLDNILPPLPSSEWHRLEGLARGTIPVEEFIPRRPRAGPSSTNTWQPNFNPIENESKVLQHLRNPGRVAETGVEEVQFEEDGGLKAIPEKENDDKRMLPRRALRRLYANIWSQSPMMTQNKDSSTWETKWGTTMFRAQPAPASPSDAELFEGFDQLEIRAYKKSRRGRV